MADAIGYVSHSSRVLRLVTYLLCRWNCIGGNIKPTRNPWFPPENCPDGLRQEVMFPSCWGQSGLDSRQNTLQPGL